MAAIAWVNGELLSPDRAAISPLDTGFLYGEGLFETMRAYGAKVFRLPQHLHRLLTAAAELSFTPPASQSLAGAIQEALDASGLEDAALRLTVTPGLAGSATPTVVVLVRPLALPPPELYASGCHVVSVPSAHAPETPLRRIKSLNYLDKVLAQRAASHKGAHEAILVDPDGCVIEGAMRNIFAVFDGELITPPLARGFLPGITRAAVLEIAEADSIPQAERDLPLTQLYAADEAFLTSSLAEILPVASTDGNPMAGCIPGPVTSTLAHGYRALVAEELGLTDDENRSG